MQPPQDLFDATYEKLQQLIDSKSDYPLQFLLSIAIRNGYNRGADDQLQAALSYLDRNNQWARVDLDEMHDALRPKPISEQQQALLAIDAAVADDRLSADVANVVRAAFKELGISAVNSEAHQARLQ